MLSFVEPAASEAILNVSYVCTQVLCLNHNHIECIMSRPRQHNTTLNRGRVAGSPIDVIPTDSGAQLLEKLEVLHLGLVAWVG